MWFPDLSLVRILNWTKVTNNNASDDGPLTTQKQLIYCGGPGQLSLQCYFADYAMKLSFNNKISTERETRAAVLAAGAYQAQAIASAWKKQPAKRIQGLYLETCHKIMRSLDEMKQAPELDVWNIHFCVHIITNKQSNGGWILFHQEAGQQWKPIMTGNLKLESNNAGVYNAAKSLQHGLIQEPQEQLQTSVLKHNTLLKTRTEGKSPATPTDG
ncbi:Hypothetical protein PHPALM_20196 [Phytophthora palmivora]|uniref:Uncharacterized protein n=1 Tax=Phytophthora palmivora TaxID=4796 RepID=A0A2P4XFH9_9STRA|nr:Hypothetical protein PHPALM_20196 [Phytophthora palmivora]